mmetsp:Transcript_26304/g.37698  ORF Transcript_26304/g.37698 Transcript_26304/m.37698 type:complete len:172 (-) Transcript_26304:91-606(-)
MMKTIVVAGALLLMTSCNAFVPQLPKAGLDFGKVGKEMKDTAVAFFAAIAIASNVLSNTPLPAQAYVDFPGTSTVVSEKVVREGMYRDYEVDLVQQYDDARSTYKPAKETKSNKGKYTGVLAVLVVGSFIIPMAQYFWYVKDDDSTDKFFAEKNVKKVAKPEPVKKKGWFS